MAGNNKIDTFTFHTNTTAIGNGNIYSVSGHANEMNLFFKVSSGGTFNAIVEVYSEETENWYPWDVYQRPSYTLMDNGITNANFIYNVDLTAIDKIRVRLTAITGSLFCYGEVVG